MAMSSFGVFDNMKHAANSTFEKMRHKLQKNAARMMAQFDDDDNDRTASRRRGSADFISEPFDFRSLGYDPVSQAEPNDIGPLPIEREQSCLQDVLEQNGLERQKRQQNSSLKRNLSFENHLVEQLNFNCQIKSEEGPVPTIPSREGVLLDLNEDFKPTTTVPPPSRSISHIPQNMTHPPTTFQTQISAPVQRSISLSQTTQNADQQPQNNNLLFDVFSPPHLKQDGFAKFDTADSSANTSSSVPSFAATLMPTPVGNASSTANASKSDPFASILTETFPSQQQSKSKITLGSLSGTSGPGLYSGQQVASNSYSASSSLKPSMPSFSTSNVPPSKPNYNISTQSTSQVPQPQPSKPNLPDSSSTAGPKFNLFAEDAFNLHGFSRSTSQQGPKTMKEMRKDILAKDLADDPEALKVRQWVEGKQGNIRALLSTLDQILWDDESRSKWEPIPIHQLVKVSEVRKAYKRAAVVCHPDKLVGTNFERISRLVFIELNEASSEFQKELDQQNNI